jgi:hypothetical protein
MCMTCASQVPAVAGSLSGLLAYGSVAGAAALGAMGLRRGRGAYRSDDLEALAGIVDAPAAGGDQEGPDRGQHARQNALNASNGCWQVSQNLRSRHGVGPNDDARVVFPEPQ